MAAPLILFLMSGLGSAILFFLPDYQVFLFPSLILTAAAAVLLLRAAFLALLRWVRFGHRAGQNVVVLDGSNVMHWRGGEPDLGTVCHVLRHLEEQGFHPGVVFDANAGYKIDGRYQHHTALARKLGLPTDRVLVVNRGEVADGMILRVARDMGARVVSNDRFRDWADQFPQVTTPGFVISGKYRQGALHLDL